MPIGLLIEVEQVVWRNQTARIEWLHVNKVMIFGQVEYLFGGHAENHPNCVLCLIDALQVSNGGRSKQTNCLSVLTSSPLCIHNTDAIHVLLFTFAPNPDTECALNWSLRSSHLTAWLKFSSREAPPPLPPWWCGPACSRCRRGSGWRGSQQCRSEAQRNDSAKVVRSHLYPSF